MEITTLNGVLKIDENVKIYHQYWEDFANFKDTLIQDAALKIEKKQVSELPESINWSLTKRIKSILTELAGYGIYDKTVDDFIETNHGYVSLLNVYTEYLDTVNNIKDKNARTADQRDTIAYNSANSQITGLDYGIITRDVLSYMVYDAINESKKKKQSEKAYSQYLKRSKTIYDEMQTQTTAEIQQYEQRVFLPNLKRAITEIISNLFAQYMSFQADQGKIDLEPLKGIDEKRSSDILENISIVEEKSGLLLTSLNLCPYNLNAYFLAVKYKLFDTGLGKAIDFLDMADVFEQKLLWSESYEKNERDNIADIYKSYHTAIQAVALSRGETESRIFQKRITPLYTSKKRKLIQLLATCANTNPESAIRFFIENHISLGNFENDISHLLPRVLMKKEFITLEKYTTINLLDELRQIDNRYTFQSYEDIAQFIQDELKVYKSFWEEKENKERLKKEHEKQKEDRQCKRGIAMLVALLLFLIFFPKVFRYCQYQLYARANGKAFAGIDCDTTPNELINLLGEPEIEKDIRKDGSVYCTCTYEDIDTFGTKCTIDVRYYLEDGRWPNNTSVPKSCSVKFEENSTIKDWYECYFYIKFGLPHRNSEEWETSDMGASINSEYGQTRAGWYRKEN